MKSSSNGGVMIIIIMAGYKVDAAALVPYYTVNLITLDKTKTESLGTRQNIPKNPLRTPNWLGPLSFLEDVWM